MISLLELGANLLDFLWQTMLLLAPILLLGLFLSGLFHVFISRQAILKWLKKDDLKAISTSAAIGVPIPLCSCSVLPVVAEMRNKGASRSACMSFLITAPETGADSILITNVFFGWVAAITRPMVSFVTAVVAGLSCARLAKDEEILDRPAVVDDCCESSVTLANDPCANASAVETDDCCDGQSARTNHEYLVPAEEDCYVSISRLREATARSYKSVVGALSKMQILQVLRPTHAPATVQPLSEVDERGLVSDLKNTQPLTLQKVARHVFRYGFVSIADDILFALLIGVFLGGIIYLAVPSDWMNYEYARWISYPVMLLVAMPLYICASASTPIAAALVVKGVSPGAALIFLMTGPATNTATISVILSQFGARFASIYVIIVMAVTVIIGIGLDFLLLATGFELLVNLEQDHSHAVQVIQWISVIAFVGLVVWRFSNGAFQKGWRDMLGNLRSW
ncbi:MAG: hypothetical protein F4X44_10455 [Gammaproteobacteria bacterium]|nr:hypothetical protein [Gammaproteobacteria bacterium]MYD81019.1 hypothetical protein [Gammaproteobacteria bacterium]